MSTLLVTVYLEEEDRRELQQVVRPGTKLVTREEIEVITDEALSEVEVILCAGLHGLPPTRIRRMESLKMVQTLLAGADHLPPEVFKPGTAVCTGSGAASHHVAEHAFALLLAAARNVVTHTDAIRAGRFDRSPTNRPLLGLVLGIVGLGNVGRAVAHLGRAFGMKVMAINRSGRTPEAVDFIGTLEALQRVLRDSDYVVLCLPLTLETSGLIGSGELETMKESAVLVNVARGDVVQEKALYNHLRSHREFRAASDVWWRYPEGERGRPYTHPFHQLENFIATPHVAGHVPGHRKAMMRLAIENIGNFYMGKPLMNRVAEKDSLPPGME